LLLPSSSCSCISILSKTYQTQQIENWGLFFTNFILSPHRSNQSSNPENSTLEISFELLSVHSLSAQVLSSRLL
jgi:hypothetical protein